MSNIRELIYIASQRTREETLRLTVPPPLFDDVPILSRDRGGYWSVDTETEVLVISSRHPETRSEYAHTRRSELSASGTTRYFTIPEKYRMDTENSDVPESARLGTNMLRFFITTPEQQHGHFRSCYVPSATQLQSLVETPTQWQDSSANRRRLADLLQYGGMEHLYPFPYLSEHADLSYCYTPSKPGTIKVSVEHTKLRARWYKPCGMKINSGPTELFVIETEFTIIDPETQQVTPAHDTKQYRGTCDPVGTLHTTSSEGTLDHVPKAIRRALHAGNWHLKETPTNPN